MTVHAAFQQIALAKPDAVAVSDATRRLTYRELDERSTAWARVLVDHGAGPGRHVGVCLKRTVDLVVALLAVLKSGAAYVPMDVQSPDERLRHTAADSGAALVVTGISDFPAERLLRPADLAGASVSSAAELPPVGPDSPAYVVYTSGTTGRPKGVVVPHRNVMALLAATADDLGLGPADVWTFFHSSAFDFSVWEIWGCLLTGGRLVVVPQLTARSPEEFRDLLVRERVSVLSQTPSAFAGLVGLAGPSPRLVVFGGEALDPRAVVGWLRDRPASRMVNMYGITETTVHVTTHDIEPRDLRRHCVGRALPGWSVSVRDSRGRPLPLGAVGEICVGGAGLAHGYLHRPQLTSERFVELDGERLYRSGDLGRLHPDGTLDHLGRLDDQVKIRGFRIELGEIRSVLLADPGVTDAAVVVLDRERGSEYARLVAYVVLGAGAAPSEVRHRIAAVLPDYMLPTDLVAMPTLPLTGNGKLDRAALLNSAEPAEPVADGAGSAVGAMVTVWRSVVRADLHQHAHFFDDLGGNSLLAVRLLSALRKAGFGSLALRDLYRHPTPAALAAGLAGGANGSGQ
jgi:amino acid adenylation domain-containing protein